MILCNPLIADLGDLIGFIIFLVIMGFSLLSKLSGAKEAIQQKPRRVPPNPVPQPRPVQQKSIEREIEEFLSQARGAASGAQPPAPTPKPPVMARRQLDVELDGPTEPGRDFGQSVASHVQQHIGSGGLEDRASRLGQAVANVDEEVEHHLEEVFDHDIGKLSHVVDTDTSVAQGTDSSAWEKDEQAPKIETTPAAIRRLLSNPDDIRSVFIISEILKRPDN
jgi:hypothetical protein